MNKCLTGALLLVFLVTVGASQLVGQNVASKKNLRKPHFKTYVIAHRGAHAGIPENSLPAYQKAIDLGCDFVEIDARLTKDGKIVSIHNATIDQYVKKGSGEVKKMTLAEIKALDIGLKTGPEWKGTQIPTVEEILQLCQGKIGIYLDLKDAPIDSLMALLRKYKMGEEVVWYIPASYLFSIENVDSTFGSSFIMPDPGSEKKLDEVLAKLNPRVVATDMGALSKTFVEKCHANGAKVFVDEKEGTEAEWQQILEWGTDGIQTDHPEELIRFLNAR
ncbi:glycerophosphodiester phosphodiesterase family protein [Maribellus sp. CM-23]|uniref:glycerophosphodiester phosphodiesterase n=1 Tax=Maribellus sp. CM-23 TaxID=2781026 RepID=UPI001F26A3E3|nr:glycerophosphodiester phosphodiesterase family protein [Maribellus sp. CM-23]MCE4562831.1 glycerophosphodiester phosphodiesterase family protein [Maribellus sp. CM-23]